MSALEQISEFISKQLNDHESSPRGAEQPTYYVWPEHHIHDALNIATSYLYSLKPDLFANKQCYELPETACTVVLKDVCCNVLDIIGVGSDCDNVSERKNETNNLLPLLSISPCYDIPDDPTMKNYSYDFKGEGIVQFDEEVPAGTKIFYICALPVTIDNLPECTLEEYRVLFTSFALWIILLTDNESRSNQPRWQAYYEMLRDFVEIKLRLEFSLRSEDYVDGHKLSSRRELDSVQL